MASPLHVARLKAACYGLGALLISWYVSRIPWTPRDEADWYGFAWVVQNATRLLGYAVSVWFVTMALAIARVSMRMDRSPPRTP